MAGVIDSRTEGTHSVPSTNEYAINMEASSSQNTSNPNLPNFSPEDSWGDSNKYSPSTSMADVLGRYHAGGAGGNGAEGESHSQALEGLGMESFTDAFQQRSNNISMKRPREEDEDLNPASSNGDGHRRMRYDPAGGQPALPSAEGLAEDEEQDERDARNIRLVLMGENGEGTETYNISAPRANDVDRAQSFSAPPEASASAESAPSPPLEQAPGETGALLFNIPPPPSKPPPIETTIAYENGDVYTGKVDVNDGIASGEGSYSYNQGKVVATGEFRQGALNGLGKLEYASGDTFVGQFVKDRPIRGEFLYNQDNVAKQYSGTFRQSLPSGAGTLSFRNGDSYSGQFENGRPHGNGVYTFKGEDGGSVSGEFDKGTLISGIHTGASGNRYSGRFNALNGTYHGPGLLKFANGDVYDGEFAEGSFHGPGVYVSAESGVRITSNAWFQGRLRGDATMTTSDGTTIQLCIWDDGFGPRLATGAGIMWFPDGSRFQSITDMREGGILYSDVESNAITRREWIEMGIKTPEQPKTLIFSPEAGLDFSSAEKATTAKMLLSVYQYLTLALASRSDRVAFTGYQLEPNSTKREARTSRIKSALRFGSVRSAVCLSTPLASPPEAEVPKLRKPQDVDVGLTVTPSGDVELLVQLGKTSKEVKYSFKIDKLCDKIHDEFIPSLSRFLNERRPEPESSDEDDEGIVAADAHASENVVVLVTFHGAQHAREDAHAEGMVGFFRALLSLTHRVVVDFQLQTSPDDARERALLKDTAAATLRDPSQVAAEIVAVVTRELL